MSQMHKKIGALMITAVFIAAPSVAGTASSADFEANDGVTATGMSNVYRSGHGVGLTAILSGLTPDRAHTMWAAIFNRPHKCFVPNACTTADAFGANPPVNFQLTQAARNWSDDSGNSNLSGFIPQGSALQRPNRAEIHFIYIEHDPLQGGGSEYVQLNSGAGRNLGFSVHQH